MVLHFKINRDWCVLFFTSREYRADLVISDIFLE